MSSNNRPLLPRNLAPAPSGASHVPPPDGDRPSNVVEPRRHQLALRDQWARRDPMPAITRMPVSQVLPQDTEAAVEGHPAERQTPLLPAPAGEGVPAFQELNRRPPRMTTRTRDNRAPQACQRCRRKKLACGPDKPRCHPCVIAGRECIYGPTQHQIQQARMQARFRFIHRPPPVETSPAAVRGRRLRPLLKPLAAGHEELAPGSAQQRQHAEVPRTSFGGFAAGPEAQPQLPEGYSGMYGGHAAGSASQQDYPQEFGSGSDDNGMYGRYPAGPAGPQDYPQGYGLGSRENVIYRGYAPLSVNQQNYPQGFSSGSDDNGNYGVYPAGSAGQPNHPQGFGSGSGENRLYGDYAAGPAGPQDNPHGYGLVLGGLDSRSNQSSQQPQGHNAGYGGLGRRGNEPWQLPQRPYSSVQEPYTGAYGDQQNPQQPLWNVEEFRRRQRDTVRGTQQPAFVFGGYQPTPSETSSVLGGYQPAPSEPSPFLGEPMLASRESSVLHGSSSYARAPGMVFDGTPASSFGNTQSSNEPEMMPVFNNFAQPGQDGGHDARGLSHDEAWDAAIDYDADRTP